MDALFLHWHSGCVLTAQLLLFMFQAVRAIGRCAVSLDKAAQRCIAVLLELIQTKVNYVVQEAVIVIKVCPQRPQGTLVQVLGVNSTPQRCHCCMQSPLGLWLLQSHVLQASLLAGWPRHGGLHRGKCYLITT